MNKNFLFLIPLFLAFSLIVNSCTDGGGTEQGFETKEQVLFEDGEWTEFVGSENVTVGADIYQGLPGGIMFEFDPPLDVTGYNRLIIVFKTAPDVSYWFGGELQSDADVVTTGWMEEGVTWNPATLSASLPFSTRTGNFDPSRLEKVLFKGGGPNDNSPVWELDDIEKVYVQGRVARKGFCDICFYNPCRCEDLCWNCGEEVDGCICRCESCGQQVCITEPPELPAYYNNPTARWKKSDDAIWLGCYEADSDVQFRWVIDSETKARIKTGEINRFLLYLDADKIHLNTHPAPSSSTPGEGRIGTVTVAVNATKKDGSNSWRQMSGSFNYPTVTGNTIKSQGEPLVFFLNHSEGWDLIDWGEESMFQIYVQCTASSGYIEGIHFISGYLDLADYIIADPAACDDCGKLICECLPPFPYQLPSEYTWHNNASQLGYGFGVRWGDPSFTAFAASKYMVFEVKSNNATEVPAFRLVFLGAGQSSHSNNTLRAGLTPFANAVDSIYYVVVELEKILETNSLANDANGTAWEKIKAGSSARFYMQDGWPARVQRTFLLDSLPNANPADKVNMPSGVQDALDRILPAFITADRNALGIPAVTP